MYPAGADAARVDLMAAGTTEVARREPSATSASPAWPAVSPSVSRMLLLAVVCSGVAAGLLGTEGGVAAHAVAQAGPDLTRLMRAMALLKAMIAVATTAAVLWRLGSATALMWLALYVSACAAMAAGPGLIWQMAHVTLGSVLLHVGLVAAIVTLWRDPVVGHRLAALVEAKRVALRNR